MNQSESRWGSVSRDWKHDREAAPTARPTRQDAGIPIMLAGYATAPFGDAGPRDVPLLMVVRGMKKPGVSVKAFGHELAHSRQAFPTPESIGEPRNSLGVTDRFQARE